MPELSRRIVGSLDRIRRGARAAPGFAILLGIGVLVRILCTVAYRPAFLLVGDSYQYLSDAAVGDPGLFRASGYATFLRLLLLGSADSPQSSPIWIIPVAQHALGLTAGVLTYLLLRRLEVRPWLAALGAAPVLLDAYQVNIEHFVMAETLFDVLLLGSLFLLIGRARPSARVAVATGVLLAAATLTRSVALVLIVPVLLYAGIRRHGARNLIGIAAGFVVPVVAYAAWFGAVHGAVGLSGWDGWWLYGRVAPFAQCERLDLSEDQQALCGTWPEGVRNPVFFTWEPLSPASTIVSDYDFITANETLRRYSLTVIRQQPGDYLTAVAQDTLHFFSPRRFDGQLDSPMDFWRFPLDSRPDERGDSRAGYELPLRIVTPLATFLRGYQKVVFTPGPVLALFVTLGVAGAVLRRRSGRPVRAECLLLMTCGLAMLIVPSATVMFEYRYVVPALVLLPAAGAIGLSAILDRASASAASGSRRELEQVEPHPVESPP